MAGLLQKERTDGNYHKAAIEDSGEGWEGAREDGVAAVDMFKEPLRSSREWRICYPYSKKVRRGVSQQA